MSQPIVRTAGRRAKEYLEEAIRLRRERDEARDEVRRLQYEVERLQREVQRFRDDSNERADKVARGRSEVKKLAAQTKARMTRYKKNRDRIEKKLARGQRAAAALRGREHWEWSRDELVKLLRRCATQDDLRSLRVTEKIVNLYAALRPRVAVRFGDGGPLPL